MTAMDKMVYTVMGLSTRLSFLALEMMKTLCYKSGLIMSNGLVWPMFEMKDHFVPNNIMGLMGWYRTPSTLLNQLIELIRYYPLPFQIFQNWDIHIGSMGAERK